MTDIKKELKFLKQNVRNVIQYNWENPTKRVQI